MLVHALRGFQNVEIDAHRAGQMNERLHILGKAKSAKAQTCAQELPADARIEAHRACNFFHVRSDFFAQVRNHIGIADFQRQEGVRGVLDELGAVDRSDQQCGGISRRARAVVDRAMKRPLQNRPVNLSHIVRRGFVFHPHDNAIRMKEILNRGSFPQKLRV